MTDQNLQLSRVDGSGKTSVEDAVQNAITKPVTRCATFVGFRAKLALHREKNYWRVTIKLGFRLDD